MAKFKVGDKVFVDWISGDSERGVVIGTDNNGLYKVKLTDGKTASVREGLIIPANSCRNSVVANSIIKSGDEVEFKGRPELGKFQVLYVEGDSAKIRSKSLGAPDTFEKVSHLVKVGRAVNYFNTANSVVANAIAWKAKNG